VYVLVSLGCFFGRCFLHATTHGRQRTHARAAAAFSRDGLQLLAGGSDGVVYRWDMRTFKCMERFVDEGSAGITSIAACGSYYAVGCGQAPPPPRVRAFLGAGDDAAVIQCCDARAPACLPAILG
jgi:hypothetical protein